MQEQLGDIIKLLQIYLTVILESGLIQSGAIYNAVQYHTILHTSLQLPRQNINQSVNPQKTHPYLALTGELMGVFCKNFQGNWPR